MPGRTSIRFRFEFCWFDRTAPCSGRQMRNSFFALNMIAWVVIVILAVKLIA
jgi:disulfide bond formation protein DsbB